MLRKIISGVTATVAVCAILSLADGCLDRPVEAGNPITRTNFLEQIQQSSIDKVDLLFDIDNSASMGDKQAYLKAAIPDLIGRLVMPNCVDKMGNPTGAQSDINGNCVTGNPEFPPVHNMHVGVVSSSLGPRLGGPDVCPTTAMDPDMTNQYAWQPVAGGGAIDRHNDDQGHLLDRGSDPNNLGTYTETPLGAAQDSNPGGGNFLDWFPTSNMNNSGKSPDGPVYSKGPQPSADPMTLTNDFAQLVVGVHQFGCGIESQLESWYRFLIQPDPYASLTTDGQGRAQWVGVDKTILAQRADFLRPDSLVAILVLSDENDSEVDVRAFSGSAWHFMSTTFPPPRGTSPCLTNPADPNCTSCQFPGHETDPECMKGAWPGDPAPPNWGNDLNLRHVHEKLKYGVDVQFPIERYLVGLTSTRVPNRDGEYPPDGKGGYASSYQGIVKSNQNCTNPLFAKTLPSPPNGNLDAWNPQWSSGNPPADPNNDLCNMPVGSRLPNLVFYAHIGGVPHQLLQNDPTKTDTASQSQKDTLTPADWTLILGNDPENYDYAGIDPHMIESYEDRSGAAVPPNGFHVFAPSSPEGTDPISGREWVTDSTMPEHTGLHVDREYACIFPLQTARMCDPASVAADPTRNESCDCLAPAPDTGSFTHSQVPAVCNDATPTRQDSAKAYPTIRELLLAKLMGQQGVVSSLCPIHTMDNATNNDPLYGYRPAMNAIVNALRTRLGVTCLPQPLSIAPDPVTQKPAVQCLILGTFPSGPGQPTSCGTIPGGGWSNADPTILKHFKDDQTAGWQASGSPGTDPATLLTCQLQQLPPNVDCGTKASGTATMPADGWCYFENPTTMCGQAILFSANAKIDGVVTSLQCLEQSPSVIDAGGSAGH